MTLLKNKNYAFSTLAGNILIGATSLTVDSGHGARFPATGIFMAAIWGSAYSSPGNDPDRELITMSLTGGDTFTITRAAESTIASAWSTGDNIALVVTAGKLDELEDKIQDGIMSYVLASGTNSYVGVFDPAITTLETGTRVHVKFANASTGACTFQMSALAAKKLYGKQAGSYVALGSGDITAGMMGILIYDATLDGGGGGFIITNWQRDKLYGTLNANNQDISAIKDITSMNDITSMQDITSMNDIGSMNDIISMRNIDHMTDITLMNNISTMKDIDVMLDINSMNDIRSMRDIISSRNITFTETINSIAASTFAFLSGVTSNIQTQLTSLVTKNTDFIGEIVMCPIETPFIGTLECNGTAISRVTYSSLFGVIGTTYGVGNGSTTFNLPDLRGMFLRGWDHGANNDAGSVVSFTGNINSNTLITGITDISILERGMTITGTGIPAGTTIVKLYAANTIEISQAATATATGITFASSNRTDRGDGTVGDHVGTKQSSMNKAHNNGVVSTNTGNSDYGSTSLSLVTHIGGSNYGYEGGVDARPININIMYCIRYR